MPNTVVFLWISARALSMAAAAPAPEAFTADASDRAEQPSPRALRVLADFGAARGLNFAPPAATRPIGLPTNDAAFADALETELEQARTALSALEEAAAGARLSRIESRLLSHPHLPQAAFLMSEYLALRAQAARELQPARAIDFEARRFALEGPRAAAFGATAQEPAPRVGVTLALRGLAPADALELDGEARNATEQTSSVTLLPGLHHARVWRGDQPIFAAFVEVAAEQTALQLDVPPLIPCSAEDFQGVLTTRMLDGGRVPTHVACARWAEVRAEGSALAVALCAYDRCGPSVRWELRSAAPFRPISVESERFPTWAGAAIATGAALLASGLVLWQAGAFERGQHSAASWEYRGLNPQALRF